MKQSKIGVHAAFSKKYCVCFSFNSSLFLGEGSRSVEQILRIASKYRKVDNFDSSQAFAQLRVLSVTVTTNGKEPYKVYPGE